MFRTFSLSKTSLRSLTQTLTSKPHSLTPIQILSSPYSQSSKQNKEDTNDDVSSFNRDPTSPPKLFVVQPRLRPDTHLHAKLDEALNLANSLEEQRDGFFDTELCDKELPPHVVVQNPAARTLHADTYFGTGTVETVKCNLSAEESKKGEVDAVFVNTILSGVQQRNLERAWGKPVLDRVGLIIEIFNAHAQTKEAKLQAELAALMYKKTRLVRIRGLDGRYTFGANGEAEVVSARGRGSGGRGFISGAGETELQLQRRRILERRNYLLSQIEEVRRTRALQRAARKRHGGLHGQGLATVAVVGYTNAGKSTLVSVLSNTDLYSDDRLFATVDPKLRSVVLPSGRKVLLSDTVGFISDLPVQLVEAFHATLEEVAEADLLVHVLDSSAPNLDEHRSTVLQVLGQIGVSEEKLQNMIEVWNKIDLQEGDIAAAEYLDNGEDGEASIFSREEDDNVVSELSPGEDDDENGSFSGTEDDVVSEPSVEEHADHYDDDNDESNDDVVSEMSSRNLEETMDDQQGDSSDSWLSADHDQRGWNPLDDQQTESSKAWRMEKDSQSQGQHVPHVKTSAVMGVGLQELLKLIDEKLKPQDDNPKAQQVVERCYFDRKWRPPRTEDAGIAVEQ